MSTRSLLLWVALVAGVELLARGYLGGQQAWLHGGAWLLVAALAGGAWRLRTARRSSRALLALAAAPALLSLASAVAPDEPPDPRLHFWRAHPEERARLLEGLGDDPALRRVVLFDLPIALDARGFRRIEPPADARRHRIVAVGGSDTFGATRSADERPWPTLLEEAITRELRCETPVEVVNAGVPGARRRLCR